MIRTNRKIRGWRHAITPRLCSAIALVAILCYGNMVHADANQEVRLFVVEKSKNPQNILVVYANVNTVCNVQSISDAGSLHLFDLYWLMNGTTFKPTHRLIKKAARKRFVAQGLASDGQSFTVVLTDLKELRHDLPTDRIRVEINRDTNGRCQAQVLLPLGPSHHNRTMAIHTIYSEAKTFISIPVGIHYIELRGTDTQSNEPIVVRYNSTSKAEEGFTTDAVDRMARDNQ